MSRIQISFTNNTSSDVALFSLNPTSRQESLESNLMPGTTTTIDRDIPGATEWRMKDSATGAVVGTYQTTSDARQNYLIGGYRIQLRFINTTQAGVILFSVDPTSRQERQQGSVAAGAQSLTNTNAFLGTEWRIKDEQTGALIQAYLTTADPYQSVSIVQTPGVIPVTDPIIPTVTSTMVVTPIITSGVEITSAPINLTNPPLRPTPTPVAPTTVAGARDSIFNTGSFNIPVINIEYSIRQQAGTTDKNQLRAAIYAVLMEIAKSSNRTRDGQAVMEWLALQVKQTRVEAARLALAEYDRWNHDPWSYEPPAGYDFPAYVIPVAQSPIWLTTTPNPPVLSNKSWQSFFADIISNNGWSPLNNPMLSKGQSSSSLENVIGFPVFGTVLAYQKLYGTVEGVRTFAETAAHLSDQPLNLGPIAGVVASPGALNAARVLKLEQIAPFSQRNLDLLAKELRARIAGTSARVPLGPSSSKPGTMDLIRGCTDSQLRSAIARITSGDIIGSFVVSFVLSSALQEIISQSIMLDTKIKLRGELVSHLGKQQSAQPPDLANLLYYDIRGEVALYGADYQPTDQAELERMMGSQEVYRAFLLSTIQ